MTRVYPTHYLKSVTRDSTTETRHTPVFGGSCRPLGSRSRQPPTISSIIPRACPVNKIHLSPFLPELDGFLALPGRLHVMHYTHRSKVILTLNTERAFYACAKEYQD